MALDTLVEVAARALGQFVLEVLLVGIFYWPGWLICRALTFGRYPPSQDTPHNREFVAIVALVAFIALLTIYYSHARC
jgi:hypothetical protein